MSKFQSKWMDWKRKRARVVKKRIQKPICNDVIKYPELESEFEIQSILFSELRQRGFDVRGEVKAGIRSRFDLVVFRDRTPIRIIEVKKRKIKANTTSVVLQHQRQEMLSQIERYKTYGVTVDVVQGMKDARLYLEVFFPEMPAYVTITKRQTKEVRKLENAAISSSGTGLGIDPDGDGPGNPCPGRIPRGLPGQRVEQTGHGLQDR